MKILKLLLTAFAVSCLFFMGQVSAITITPDDCVAGDCWTTNVNNNSDAAGLITTTTKIEGLVEVYKAEADPAREEGSFASLYTIEFFEDPNQDPSDFSGATITWEGLTGDNPIPCPTCILEIKGGRSDPARYYFDLGNWDGISEIVMSGFWEDPVNGGISHVSIWITAVPVPAAVWLFGTALLGLVGFKRRQAKA